MKDAVEKIALGFIGLAALVAFVSAKNTPNVVGSVFKGSAGLFGTILSPVSGSAISVSAPISVNG